MLDFTGINYFAVLVASLAGFAIGAMWYSPVLFSKIWVRETGLKQEELANANMAMIFGTTFVFMFIQSLFLAAFMAHEEGLVYGIVAGGLAGLGWVVTSVGILFLFERRTLKLFLINAGYLLVAFIVMGAIHGVWK